MNKLAFVVTLLTTVWFGQAHAVNNSLVEDARARGYSFTIHDVIFGSGSYTSFGSEATMRIVLVDPKKHDSVIEVPNWNQSNREVSAQADAICVEMFGTPDRLQKFEIRSGGYHYVRAFLSLSCVITAK